MNTTTTTTAVLTKTAEGKYRVSGVGTPAFWPHDGDLVGKSDIEWLRAVKRWKVVIVNNSKERKPT